jgi:hypothetical protein
MQTSLTLTGRYDHPRVFLSNARKSRKSDYKAQAQEMLKLTILDIFGKSIRSCGSIDLRVLVLGYRKSYKPVFIQSSQH